MIKCGECKYNRRDWTNLKNPDFYCGNIDSDNYGYNTTYPDVCDGCEDGEEKDTISRAAAIDCVERSALTDDPVDTAIGLIEVLPSAQEIIRCKDCKWWDKYGENHGYCMRVRRWGEFFCADAERREE